MADATVKRGCWDQMEKDRFFWLGMGPVCHNITLGRGPSQMKLI